MIRFRLWPLLAGVLLAGCVTVPSGPGVVVLPEAGKNFEQFREEDAVCRQYAKDEVGATPEQAAADSVARSTGTGALVGAVFCISTLRKTKNPRLQTRYVGAGAHGESILRIQCA